MTEAEWFASNDARRVAGFGARHASPRKLRLFMVAWCRRHCERITAPISRDVIDLAELFADGKASKKQLEAMYDAVRGVVIADGVNYVLWPDSRQMAECVDGFCRNDYYLPPWSTDEERAAREAERVVKARMLRDVIGNPFRPVTFSREWRTTVALRLAQQMYVSRDFALMPILADALEDAGCNNADVLAHCRDPGAVHVRGCWVVDLVLGKS